LRSGARGVPRKGRCIGVPWRRSFVAIALRASRMPGRRGSLPLVNNAVELHIISDATGETATRLVAALEAQFPEQPFEVARHPRVETVDDLRLAVNRTRGRPAVIVYTIVKPELRSAMRDLCKRARVHYCDVLGHPIE